MPGLGPDARLELCQPSQVARENVVGLIFLPTEGGPAVERGKVESFAGLHREQLAQGTLVRL